MARGWYFEAPAMLWGGELYLIAPDATGLQRLTTRTGEEHRPDWSPDGSRIAFDDGGDLWRINVDGSELVQLTTSPGTDNFLDWVE
jgi:Tol biopolymer transport system component